MATQQEKLAPISETSALKGNEYVVEDYEEAVTSSGCGCFEGPCFGWRQNNNVTHRYLLHQQEGETKESWLVNKVKKVKEISEVLAGPKWKNFIRRFKKKRRMLFQYDPQSYALNFDDGIDREVPDGGYLNFSARYVAPVGI